MRYLLFLLVLSSMPASSMAQENDGRPRLDLIPWPVEVKQPAGAHYYELKEARLYTDFPGHDDTLLISYLGAELARRNIRLTLSPGSREANIRLLMRRMPTGGKPAYRLSVDKDGISIESNFSAPAFHGIQTLLQLLPAGDSSPGSPAALRNPLPFVNIFDHARFSYRGMHLDVGRHFSGISFIKKYIDYLAYHKLNVFHWHLTEDQGWRIQINKYPELTRTGAWRNGTIMGRYPGTGNDNIYYGGYYTQDEIREVVQYAKERFIEVIPEIEMPGHSSAAIAAYPFLSCFPGQPTEIPANMISKRSIEEQKNGRIKLVQETWGIFDDVFCAGNDSTFIFLQDVIDEVTELFPSRYFHIGGDECPKTHWKKCPRCQERIRSLNLKDEHELQSYFVQRIEKYLNAKGKILVGWDEILEGGLAPNAIVMSWRGENGGVEAAKQQHYVIMSPQNPVYFDHTQSENEDSVTIGGFNPLEKVYGYEPVPKELSEAEASYILGAQANVWREYMKNEKKVEYMIFPRMSALSEVLWSPRNARSWESFTKRLPAQMKRYESWGANHSRAFYEFRSFISPAKDGEGIRLTLRSNGKNLFYKSAFIKNHDAGFSNGKLLPFRDSITERISESGTYWAMLFSRDTLVTQVRVPLSFNKATGKKISLGEPASPSYPGDGEFTLINGVINSKGFSRAKEFLGWSGKDCEAIIDLGVTREISSVVVNALKRRSSWIWEPSSAEVFASADGKNWHSLQSTTEYREKENQKITMSLSFAISPARYVKVLVRNHGVIAAANPGAGREAWLFIDEIEIE